MFLANNDDFDKQIHAKKRIKTIPSHQLLTDNKSEIASSTQETNVKVNKWFFFIYSIFILIY